LQIAGATCFVCNGHIGTVRGTVGCRACETFAHEACAEGDRCPHCGAALLSGDELHAAPSRANPAYDAGLGPWFPVATHKFIVLSVCSFGIYEFYWLYQNWRRVRNSSNEGLSPFWRALLAPIWIIPLLRRIRASAAAAHERVGWNPELLSVLFVALTASQRLSGGWWIITFSSCLALLPAVKTCQVVNRVQQSPEGTNSRYTTQNMLTIILGGLLFAWVIGEAFVAT